MGERVQTSKPQKEEWVEIKFFIARSWRDKLEKISKERGYRKLSEFLRDIIRDAIERGDQ